MRELQARSRACWWVPGTVPGLLWEVEPWSARAIEYDGVDRSPVCSMPGTHVAACLKSPKEPVQGRSSGAS